MKFDLHTIGAEHVGAAARRRMLEVVSLSTGATACSHARRSSWRSRGALQLTQPTTMARCMNESDMNAASARATGLVHSQKHARAGRSLRRWILRLAEGPPKLAGWNYPTTTPSGYYAEPSAISGPRPRLKRSASAPF